MTYSILAYDHDSGELGAAAVTGNLAVGAWVLFAEANTGVVASQGFSVSTLWGQEALRRLSAGDDPETIVKNLTADDTGAGYRQLTVLDNQSRTAGWTGDDNKDAKGHHVQPGLAVAGNWLANDKVLATLEEEYLSATGEFAARLLKALDAASRAGGDARGMMSAAIKIAPPYQPVLDLRIDCSETPIDDLCALWQRTREQDYRDFLERLPTVKDPNRC